MDNTERLLEKMIDHLNDLNKSMGDLVDVVKPPSYSEAMEVRLDDSTEGLIENIQSRVDAIQKGIEALSEVMDSSRRNREALQVRLDQSSGDLIENSIQEATKELEHTISDSVRQLSLENMEVQVNLDAQEVAHTISQSILDAQDRPVSLSVTLDALQDEIQRAFATALAAMSLRADVRLNAVGIDLSSIRVWLLCILGSCRERISV